MSERSCRTCIDENQSRPCDSGTCPEPSVSPWVPPDTNADSEAVRLAREMVAALPAISGRRVELVASRCEREAIARALRLYEAQFDARHIRDVGGEKVIGSNAEARERSLTITRAADAEWLRLAQLLAGIESKCEYLRIALDDLLDAQTARRYLVRALTPHGGME